MSNPAPANIFFFENPFEPTQHRHLTHAGEVTVREWLREHFGPDWVEFGVPTLAMLNGRELMRAEWETELLKPGDILKFVTLPGYEAIVYVILAIVVIVAVAAVLMMPVPQNPGELPNADPTYTIKGQTNQLRLMEPIEVVYGRCRVWPSYASRPYNVYSGNEQYQFNLFCFGQGEFEIDPDEIMIEDTPVANFQDVTFQIVNPGEAVTLFPDNVITSIEVSNLQLFGPNEDEFDGWVGPFVANGPGTKTNRIELDVIFPQGLYGTWEGAILNQTSVVEFERREIDDDGNPVGGWVTLGDYVFTRAENTPQRVTIGVDVPEGRYEVRGQRTNNVSGGLNSITTTFWEALRTFLPSRRNYGNVTLLAIKLRASNNLNDNSRQRVNAFVTRKLPTWHPVDGWTDPVPTRSIVWALVDLFRSYYGGKLADEYVDLAGLYAEHVFYTVQGKTFDWVFDQRGTVWEAARAICRVGRAVPMLFGSRVGMVRDKPKTLPTVMFTPDNIVKDSWRLNVACFEPDAVDHVIMEYVNPQTWKQETVVAAIPGMSRENGENIKFAGCTSRLHAWREGMYILLGKHKWRKECQITTGLEGNIPTFGDLASISHDVPRWNQFGIVNALDVATVYRSEDSSPNMFQLPELRNGRVWLSSNGKDNPDGSEHWEEIYWSGSYWAEHIVHGDAHGTGAYGEDVATPDLVDGLNLEAGVAVDLALLSKDVTFGEPWVAFSIMFRNKLGGIEGPFPVEPGPDASTVIVTLPPSFDPDDLVFDNNKEPVMFSMGMNELRQGLFQITNLTPSGDDTVAVSAVNYTDEVFAYDEESPDPEETPTLPPITPDLPEVTGLVVTRPKGIGGIYKALASWNPAPGASYYLVETSADGANWTARGQVTVPQFIYSVQLAQTLWIRVAAVGVAAGPWNVWNGDVGFATEPPAAVVGLVLDAPFTGLAVETSWQPNVGAAQYRVRVYETGESVPLRVDDTTDTAFDYTNAMAAADGTPVRNMTIEVAAVNSAGESTAATLDVYNAPPSAPTGLGSALDSGTTYNVIWTHTAPADFLHYKVYKSTTPGFTPGPGNLVYTGTANGCQINTGGTLPTYWRVAALDVWGPEESMSAEATIS